VKGPERVVVVAQDDDGGGTDIDRNDIPGLGNVAGHAHGDPVLPEDRCAIRLPRCI